jgi:hypothetical protein
MAEQKFTRQASAQPLIERLEASAAFLDRRMNGNFKIGRRTLRRIGRDLSEAAALLHDVRPHIQSLSDAEHMLDGFGPRSHRPSDDLLARFDGTQDDAPCRAVGCSDPADIWGYCESHQCRMASIGAPGGWCVLGKGHIGPHSWESTNVDFSGKTA